MNKEHKVMLACALGIILLFTMTCAKSVPSERTALPLHETSQTDLKSTSVPPTTFVLPSQASTGQVPNSQVVPASTSTAISIFDNPNQVMDGNLKLSIQELGSGCHKPGDVASVTVSYENLTSNSLIIVGFDVISSHVLYRTKGQLFPVITSSSGERIFTPYDFMLIQVSNPNPTQSHLLPKRSVFQVAINLRLPAEIASLDDQGHLQVQPIPAGQYLLKFVYIAYVQNDAWKGSISSNRITICIAD